MVALAKVISNIARASMKETNDNIIRTFERNSETLARINENFGRLFAGRTFKIHSYVEQLSMSSVRGVGPVSHPFVIVAGSLTPEKVVGKESGWIGDPHEGKGTIRADHMGIAKFDSEIDPGYLEVSGTISRMVDGLPSPVAAAPEKSMWTSFDPG